MSELGAALRQFADAIDAGMLPDASMAAIVIATDQGLTKTTFVGRLTPPEPACIILLSRGIQQMVEKAQAAGSALSGGVKVPPGSLLLSPSGSTH